MMMMMMTMMVNTAKVMLGGQKSSKMKIREHSLRPYEGRAVLPDVAPHQPECLQIYSWAGGITAQERLGYLPLVGGKPTRGANDAKLVPNFNVVGTTGREIVRPPRLAKPRGGVSVQTTKK